MEQPQQIVVMTKADLTDFAIEIAKIFLNKEDTPYPSLQQGSIPKVYTRNEISKIINKTPNTVSKLIREKKLIASSFNGVYYVSEKSLTNFLTQKK